MRESGAIDNFRLPSHCEEIAFVYMKSCVKPFKDAYNNAVPIFLFRIISVQLEFLCVDFLLLLALK